MIGQTVGRYKILQKLGAGGMGEVYLAEDTELKRQDALKFLPEAYTSTPEAIARFKHEAQAAAALNHPNIITIHEVAEYEGRPYIVMEYVEGLELSEYCRQHEPSVDQILDLAIQMAEGLKEAHGKEIVHRDLKPSNILVDKSGRPKIVDFGLAKLKGATKVTATGSTLGTAAYMSPEQSQGQTVDHRTDLWSFGVILYEMLAQRLPFEAEHEAAITYTIVHEDPEPLARYKTGLSDDLQRLVTKCLAKNPEERYQSAADLTADLRALRRTSDISAVSPVAPTSKTNRTTLISVAAIAIAIVVFLILKPFKLEFATDQQATASENRLAVMYFDNLVDPSDSLRLGEIVTNLLVTDLSESQSLDIVSTQRLYDILKQLGREGQKKVDRDVATEVARKAGGRWMLLGSILRVEPQMIITSQLVEVETGSAIASQRIQGEEGDDVFALVDRLTMELKTDLPISMEAGQGTDRPIADITTHSAEAYRYYLEGLEHVYAWHDLEAEASFRKALELDSSACMVYFWLAFIVSSTERAPIIDKAVACSSQVIQKERHLLAFTIHKYKRNYARAIEELEKLIDRYPDDKLAHYWLGNTHYQFTKDYGEAARYLKRTVEIDPSFKFAWNDLAYAYSAMGDYENSIEALNSYIHLAPSDANAYDSRGDIYALAGELDKAKPSYQKALELEPDFPLSLRNLADICVLQRDYAGADSLYRKLTSHKDKTWRARGRLASTHILRHQGRFHEALNLLEAGIQTDWMETGASWWAVTKLWYRVNIIDWFYDNMDSALTEAMRIGELAAEIDTASLALKHVRAYKAAYQAHHGDVVGARKMLVQLDREIDSTVGDQVSASNFWHAWVEYEAGNAADAAALAGSAPTGFAELSVTGMFNLHAGNLGDAVYYLERAELLYDKIRFSYPDWGVLLHCLLGQAYEASGWRDKAIEEYEIFLDVWKNADSGIHYVDDARERLARLKSGDA